MHQQADAGNHNHHPGGELVQGDADIDLEIPNRGPSEGKAVLLSKQQKRDRKGRGGRGGGDPMRDPELAQEELVRDGGQERKDKEESDGARRRLVLRVSENEEDLSYLAQLRDPDGSLNRTAGLDVQ
jgi:hypothetical protein